MAFKVFAVSIFAVVLAVQFGHLEAICPGPYYYPQFYPQVLPVYQHPVYVPYRPAGQSIALSGANGQTGIANGNGGLAITGGSNFPGCYPFSRAPVGIVN